MPNAKRPLRADHAREADGLRRKDRQPRCSDDECMSTCIAQRAKRTAHRATCKMQAAGHAAVQEEFTAKRFVGRAAAMRRTHIARVHGTYLVCCVLCML